MVNLESQLVAVIVPKKGEYMKYVTVNGADPSLSFEEMCKDNNGFDTTKNVYLEPDEFTENTIQYKNKTNTHIYKQTKYKKEMDSTLKIIEHGANINDKLKEYGNIESIKSAGTNESLVQFLINNKATVNAELIKYRYDNTPLSIACRKEYISIVKYLIGHGADVNVEYKGPHNFIKTPLSINDDEDDDCDDDVVVNDSNNNNFKETYYFDDEEYYYHKKESKQIKMFQGQ
ncbi:hypothetical protein PIROE2DRAFT_3635 [Piromyces sp. E2]|nr:hypothetical protein PIROE2DRAFT_3635 [Piromyces sp. E2]|eukprot:OUM68640.1 hypothetical protein PIROE2DRAFT_3635 [Piromyces sp. E2]